MDRLFSKRLPRLIFFLALTPAGILASEDFLLADFEGKDYGDWEVTGQAFGSGPARGTLPNQLPVSGFEGEGLVNSYYQGDGTIGTLTSPKFTIEHPYINFLLGGGKYPGKTCINLLIDGEIVRTATGPNDRPGGTERLDWHSWDVSEFIGDLARIQIVDLHTGGWGHINIDHIVQSDTRRSVSEGLLLADFEGKDYGDWEVTGQAFGSGPARGTLPNQMPVSGFEGEGLVNSYYQGDGTIGTLTSPKFTIEHPYINFLLGGGKYPGKTCINLLIDGEIVRTATGPNDRPGGTERLDWHSWDVSEFIGDLARIQIVDLHTGGWGHINIDHIVQSDNQRGVLETGRELVPAPIYQEIYRPQFHFTARKNWLNDPNGLVFYRGEYHLFFQHNPHAIFWGNMTWGHAVSTDMIHWTQLDHALHPDELGTIFSGSAVVDWHNTTGFQTGDENVIVAIYTSAGSSSEESAGQPFTQSIAYSNDRGRTWIKYEGNPVLEWITGANRDPKVIWHESTQQWIMALYLEGENFALLSSPDLKEWTRLQDITLPGTSECPDFFELSIDGDPQNTRWVFWGASGTYLLGTFDGYTFEQTSGPHTSNWGRNFYAAQTWSDISPKDGRRLQIGWMTGGDYPFMPFNQQMSFPRELELHTTPQGTRLFARPIREIEILRKKKHRWLNQELKPGENLLSDIKGELFEIRADIEPGKATRVGFSLRGEEVFYDVAEQTLSALGESVPLALNNDGRITLHILLDRTSLEIFGNEGLVFMPFCFLPELSDTNLTVFAEGGNARIESLEAYELHSAWDHSAGSTSVQPQSTAPAKFTLHECYPNPFNSHVTLRFSIPSATTVTMRIHNTAGQLVRTLAHGDREAGLHTISWNGTDAKGRAVGSGLYFYSLQGGEHFAVNKMMMLR